MKYLNRLLMASILLTASSALMADDGELCCTVSGDVISCGGFSATLDELEASGELDSFLSLPSCPAPTPSGSGSSTNSPYAPYWYGWCGSQACSPNPLGAPTTGEPHPIPPAPELPNDEEDDDQDS